MATAYKEANPFERRKNEDLTGFHRTFHLLAYQAVPVIQFQLPQSNSKLYVMLHFRNCLRLPFHEAHITRTY